MIRDDARWSAHGCDDLTRRDVLRNGSLAFLGTMLPGSLVSRPRKAVSPVSDERSCIFLLLVGGPSQIDTFDPKPDAPAEVRGPYSAIKTNVPGIRISEIFPRTARHADKFAIVRSMYHTAAAIHDTGHQMIQTGRLFQQGIEHPHAGCVYSYLRDRKTDLPLHVLLPGPIGHTGGSMPRGQNAGYLGRAHDPFVLDADPLVSGLMPGNEQATRDAFDVGKEPEALRDAYGRNKFGQSCLLARRLIERGVRFVTINMFETVFNQITWDIHGATPFSPIECCSSWVGPMFDNAYATLLADLSARGLLDDTMVVATGEFGRTPKINRDGGRDHWPRVWSALFAGGGVKGGQVIGASDALGAYPKDRPTQPAEVVTSIYHSLGVDLQATLPGPEGERVPLVEPGIKPIVELF